MSAAWKDSMDAAIRRLVREAVRKGPFTKGQRDVVLAICNLWFHHKGGEGFIHPGREKLAKRSGVSVRTVASTLALLRSCHAVSPVSNLRGGYGKSTRYVVDIWAVLKHCGVEIPEVISGHLVALNCTQAPPKIAHNMRAKIAHGNKRRSEPLLGRAEKPALQVVGGLALQSSEFAEKGIG